MSAPAQADSGAPGQPERLSFTVDYFKVSLDPDGTMAEHNHFCRHQT
jgi:hypothetical protein